MAPLYLAELLSMYVPNRTLRSAGKMHLNVPCTRLKSYGDRSFSVYGPKIWNKLPVEIRSLPNLELFKSHLKSHVFRLSCSSY